MLNGNIRPSTLDGVKRLATQIKKERGIKHADALDLASQVANCANYRHALRVLTSKNGSLPRHMVLLTVYWHDKDNYHIGRETLRVCLSKPILEICGKPDFKRVRGFEEMRMVAADHFVSDMLAHSQDYARAMICWAERSLRFMEHTGLRPLLNLRAAYPDGLPKDKLPNADHTTNWFDPASGQSILVDEPYSDRLDDDARQAWARRYGWRLCKAAWPGMYFPHRCDLYVATGNSSSYDLDALMAKIDAIPAPITKESWIGDSVPSLEVFISPAAKTPQDRRRARSKATVLPKPSTTSLPYRSMFGDSRRRPAGAMPVAEHIKAGRIIKAALYSSDLSYSAYRRMNSVRSTLEDWLGYETNHSQIEGMDITDVYYGGVDSEGPHAEAAQTKSGLIRMLCELKQKLRDFYPDCAPLRKQLQRIEVSMSFISKMNTEES